MWKKQAAYVIIEKTERVSEMIVIICVDEKGGMSFNKRRQSQDRVLRERILAMTQGGRLWMTPYSQKQFAGCTASQICVSDVPWEAAGDGEYCFVETADPKRFEDRIEQLIVYNWNRAYPSDLCLGIDLSAWKLLHGDAFAGSSHERITEEVFDR